MDVRELAAAPDFRACIAEAIDLKTLHPEAMFLRILGVDYVHLKTDDEGDLYLTRWGIPFRRHLLPENWYDPPWFTGNSQRLQGTSTVYRVPTKPIENHPVRSLDMVAKWSRVGQDVDLNTFTLERNINAEFNSPFEEFGLVEELRRGEYGPSAVRVMTQKPLAIYVPPERMQPWQTGRSRDRILAKAARHPGIAIDVLRSYILLYGWIKGPDAVEAFGSSHYGRAEQHTQLEELFHRVDRELRAKGFLVADHKPTHMIVRMCDGLVRRHRDGRVGYALVDFELLSRTPENEDAVKRLRRSEYLVRQRDRFHPRPPEAYPAHLRPARVLGVDYVYGRSESTAGALWVVGNDPELFAYFLPERWRTTPVRFSDTGQVFYTQTKDRIHLVWKVSRVGELPPGRLEDPHARSLLLQGYNSPFEEFAYAMELLKAGVKTVYPRAIYMTASPGEVAGRVLDSRPFARLRRVLSPEREPALLLDHDYVTIWGYWRGLEDDDAPVDLRLWTPIDAQRAAIKGLVTAAELEEILQRHSASLAAAGFVDSNLKPDHVLLSHIPGGPLKTEPSGQTELRQCNFEFVRRI